MIVYGKSR